MESIAFKVTNPYEAMQSPFNPTPGTGRTGYVDVPPNNFPWVKEESRFVPPIQADGGQLSDIIDIYTPTKEQEQEDRDLAFNAGVPRGYIQPGERDAHHPRITLTVRSEIHTNNEYGLNVDSEGRHFGGPFELEVSTKMRIADVRSAIFKRSGIPPALQRLSYAGKKLVDASRTLEHYGVDYWHARFPNWPLVICAP